MTEARELLKCEKCAVYLLDKLVSPTPIAYTSIPTVNTSI